MLTEKQRQARRSFLGSSDVPAILGLLPYANARSGIDIYLEKVGLLNPDKTNEHQMRGMLLEPYLLNWVEQEIGKQLERDVMKVHPSELLCTNFDALVVPQGSGEEYTESVEAKSTVNDDGWGEPGTNQVPPWVAAQVYHGFACLPTLKRAYVAVICPGYMKFDTRLYVVERDDDMVRQIEAAGLRFMRDHVKVGIPPTGSIPSMETLKRLKREPNKSVGVDAAMVEEWHELGERVGKMEKRRKELAREIIASMGDAEAGECDLGTLTYMEVSRRAYECAATKYRKLIFHKRGES